MRKKLFTIILCITTILTTFQLSFGRQSNYIGAKDGMSLPNLTSGSSSQNDWSEGYSSRIGSNFGLFAEFQLSKLFSIQPEVDYIGEGGKRNGIQPFSIPDQYISACQQAFHTDKDYTYADFKNVSCLN